MPTGMSKISEKNIALVHAYIDAYNRFDIERMVKQLHPEVVFQNYSNGKLTHETRGALEFRKQAEKAARMFSERNQVIKTVNAQHATLVVVIDYMGTIAQDFPDGLKAGEEIKLLGISEFTFLEGKIATIVDRS